MCIFLIAQPSCLLCEVSELFRELFGRDGTRDGTASRNIPGTRWKTEDQVIDHCKGEGKRNGAAQKDAETSDVGQASGRRHNLYGRISGRESYTFHGSLRELCLRSRHLVYCRFSAFLFYA